MILFELGVIIGITFLLGFLFGSACIAKDEYIYAKKLRRFKIKCDFEDFMKDYYKSHPNNRPDLDTTVHERTEYYG